MESLLQDGRIVAYRAIPRFQIAVIEIAIIISETLIVQRKRIDLVDHLVMLRFKTQGNLNGDEENALNNAITHLQTALVEAMKEQIR